MALLCLHLSHGVSSMFQSIGWKNKAFGPVLDKASRWLAVLIFVGYSSDRNGSALFASQPRGEQHVPVYRLEKQSLRPSPRQGFALAGRSDFRRLQLRSEWLCFVCISATG